MSMFARNPSFSNSLLLITGDVLSGVVAFHGGHLLRFSGHWDGSPIEDFVSLTGFVFVIALIACSFFTELYSQDRNMTRKETVVRVAGSTGIAFVVLSALFYMVPSIRLWRGVLVFSLILFALFQCLWHLIFMKLPVFAKRVLIFGTGPNAQKIGHLILSTNHHHVLSGYVTCATEAASVPSPSIIGSGSSILETAIREKVHKIVISLSERRGNLPLRDILNCKLSGIDVLDAPSFYEQMTGKLLIEEMKPSWLIFSDGFRITPFKMFWKRIVDVFFSVIGLICALPIMPLIALAVRIDSPGPVLFKQVRVGKRERNFTLYKFRTMRCDAERGTGAVWATKDDCRVTRVGKVLRNVRLDELPQLYNVFKGNMSFIGPRPERPEFVEKLKEIIPYYSERHFVKPGITGWAQIKYPYGASVEDAIEKLRYDLYYIKHLSISLDLLIVLETVKVVLFGRGAR